MYKSHKFSYLDLITKHNHLLPVHPRMGASWAVKDSFSFQDWIDRGIVGRMIRRFDGTINRRVQGYPCCTHQILIVYVAWVRGTELEGFCYCFTHCGMKDG